AKVGGENGLVRFEFADEEPEKTEDGDANRDGDEMAQCATRRGPELRGFAALAVGEIVQSASVESEHGHDEHEGENEIVKQVKIAGDGNEEPRDEEREQREVAEKLDEPETGAAEAIRERVASDFEMRHYFTSTTAASLVAMMDGWYMG